MQSVSLFSQEHRAKADTVEIKKLKDVFTHAEIEGHIRNYFMSTMNEGELKDYYTIATGGAIGIETLPFKGFTAGLKGIFTHQTFSSDLNEKDEQSQRVSKWEHELYDINDLENYNDLDRLEELYISYHFKNGVVTAGKMPIKKTPLVNESDGRMKPFAFSGLQLQFKLDSSALLYAAVITHVSPRSTVEWYEFDEAIGIVTNGSQPNGTIADYEGFIRSKGMSVLGFYKTIGSSSVHLYNYHLHRFLNTSMIEWKLSISSFDFKLQYAVQFADGFQQRLSYENRYIQPNENGQLLSVKSTNNTKHSSFSLAYTYLFASGRFLFPKELGRDQINTSISRSRAEGLGNTNVLTVDYQYHLNNQTTLEIEGTTVLQNNPRSSKFNKYRIDNYYQLNTRLNHQLRGFLEGLEFSALYVYKENYDQDQAEQIFNRSNFHQINLIANYNF